MLGIMLGVMSVNALIVSTLSRLFGLGSPSAVESALMLAARGEFAFVVLQIAMQDNLLTRSTGNTILVASILSMFCVPLLSGLATAIRRHGWKPCPAGSGPADRDGAPSALARKGGAPPAAIV